MALPGYMRWLPDAALKKLGRIEFLAHGTVDGFIAGRHKSARKGARQITRADFNHFDRIYYMDESNARLLRRDYPEQTAYLPFLPDRNVADPWPYGDFSRTFADIEEGCNRILKELTE